MIASFTPEGYEGTILRPATGHAISVNVRPGSNTRVIMLVSAGDYRKIDHPSRAFTVTDLMTNMTHTLKPTSCGLGCKCAITFA